MRLLPQRVARFLELLPIRRVLERLVVLRERLFRVTLLHQYIAPGLQRIRPVRGPAALTSLQTLFEAKRGKMLPLPPKLAHLYGCLRMPLPRSHTHVFSNFVTTLDGVVSFNTKGHASGGDISGFSAQDRMVMGLLRAVADVVIIGSGTLGVDCRHVWTAEAIFPALADDYRQLRKTLGKRSALLNVVVSGSGGIDLSLPVFVSGKVQALVVTTTAGAKRLLKQTVPDSVDIRAIRQSASAISASAILDEVSLVSPGKLILVEGGPRLLGYFYAERLLDEQFLTLAPQIAGRGIGDRQLSLVMGKAFAPRDPLWGKLIDLRRGGSHLFLRYSFP
jgi:riboflavin biosynthesis pyrimidine reductase